jgi:hypothetical protein
LRREEVLRFTRRAATHAGVPETRFRDQESRTARHLPAHSHPEDPQSSRRCPYSRWRQARQPPPDRQAPGPAQSVRQIALCFPAGQPAAYAPRPNQPQPIPAVPPKDGEGQVAAFQFLSPRPTQSARSKMVCTAQPYIKTIKRGRAQYRASPIFGV